MPQTLLVIPTGIGVGLSTVMLGLEYALEQQGLRVKRFKPIEQNKAPLQAEKSFSIPIQHVEQLLSIGEEDNLLEEVLVNYKKLGHDVDVILVQGLIARQDQPYASKFNVNLAATLEAKVLILTTPGENTPEELNDQIEISVRAFANIEQRRILGCILNKVNAPAVKKNDPLLDLGYLYDSPMVQTDASLYKSCQIFSHGHFQLLGCIPWDPLIIAPRIKDIANFLQAKIIHEGDSNRRVQYVTLYARSVNHIKSAFQAGNLIITPGDRTDVILAACLAASNGIKLAGLLLTGGFEPDESVMELCRQAIATGLPILGVTSNSFRSSVMLHHLSAEIPDDDVERANKVKDFVATHLNTDWIKNLVADTSNEQRLSPAAFRYHLTMMAQTAKKKIVLPEGTEPRTIHAAVLSVQRGLAECILLGNPEDVQRVAQNNGITLDSAITILDPAKISAHYVEALTSVRKDKGLTALDAKELLQDPVVVGTMMLYQGEVDGLVSGAEHTTANTIRPALRIIKMPEGVHLVSSVFFMCMPTQVLVFADCAVNPDPNAEQLAEIAIQSADTAKAFGISPRVAMISYSTGTSGSGQDVDKVKTATALVKKQRPDLLIDGPLQYDAALIPEVAKTKAPNSPVAGKATVFIFPDLNTGNTTYKAVQRSAEVLAIGPMLQGLRKPVNDLSRGATVEDIVYTIAITAIQASN